LCLLALTLLLVSSSAFGQEPGLQAIAEEVWPGKVIQVRGADSLVVVYGGTSHQFRLEGIRVSRDLPALADRAAQMLRERLVGKNVQVRIRGYVEGGEVPIGVVRVAGADVRVDLVAEGLVAYCPRHVVDAKLQEVQDAAKQAKRGLWGSPASSNGSPCNGAT
jgi:endonuclease YncB( thermonuclease family)